jgi:hypothetical protein
MTAVRVVFLDNDDCVKQFLWWSHDGFPLILGEEQLAKMYKNECRYL